MCTSNPYQSEVHAEVYEWSKKLSEYLLPRTRAYYEIWLDEEKVAGTPEGRSGTNVWTTYTYRVSLKSGLLFRQIMILMSFHKILGFIAIIEDDKLIGFNVAIGGGMGMYAW